MEEDVVICDLYYTTSCASPLKIAAFCSRQSRNLAGCRAWASGEERWICRGLRLAQLILLRPAREEIRMLVQIDQSPDAPTESCTESGCGDRAEFAGAAR